MGNYLFLLPNQDCLEFFLSNLPYKQRSMSKEHKNKRNHSSISSRGKLQPTKLGIEINRTAYGSVHQRVWQTILIKVWQDLPWTSWHSPPAPTACVCISVWVHTHPFLWRPQISFEHWLFRRYPLVFLRQGHLGAWGLLLQLIWFVGGGSQGLSLLLLVIKARANTLGSFKKWILMIQHRSLYLCGKSSTSRVKSQSETCIAQPSCIKARFCDWVILLAWD